MDEKYESRATTGCYSCVDTLPDYIQVAIGHCRIGSKIFIFPQYGMKTRQVVTGDARVEMVFGMIICVMRGDK